MKESIVRTKAVKFAKDSIDLYKILIEEKEFVLSKQFLRSATSIGANISEAQAAQSKRDFIAKMSISSKEARETLYWLELIEYAYPLIEITKISSKAEELVKMLTAIVKTSQAKL